MIHLRLLIFSSFSIIFVVSIFPTPVFAYLDPGTGSYFFQMLIGGIIGLLFTVKIFWKKIRSLVINFLEGFRNVFNGKKEE